VVQVLIALAMILGYRRSGSGDHEVGRQFRWRAFVSRPVTGTRSAGTYVAHGTPIDLKRSPSRAALPKVGLSITLLGRPTQIRREPAAVAGERAGASVSLLNTSAETPRSSRICAARSSCAASQDRHRRYRAARLSRTQTRNRNRRRAAPSAGWGAAPAATRRSGCPSAAATGSRRFAPSCSKSPAGGRSIACSHSSTYPANGLNAVSLRGPEVRAEHFVADVLSRHATLHQLRPNVVHEGQRSAGEDVEIIRQWNVR
jgi:hypothetical protein